MEMPRPPRGRCRSRRHLWRPQARWPLHGRTALASLIRHKGCCRTRRTPSRSTLKLPTPPRPPSDVVHSQYFHISMEFSMELSWSPRPCVHGYTILPVHRRARVHTCGVYAVCVSGSIAPAIELYAGWMAIRLCPYCPCGYGRTVTNQRRVSSQFILCCVCGRWERQGEVPIRRTK